MVRKYLRMTHALPVAVAVLCLGLFISPRAGLAQTRGGVFINEEVANVNGDILTERELVFVLLREYGSQMFNDLVENELIAGQASMLGVSLDPGEVDDYLTSAYTPEKLQSLQTAFGDTLLRDTIGTEFLALKTLMAKMDQVVAEHQITIGDEEIRQFYLANLPLWIKPESVRFSLIEVATEQEAIAARARVMAGEAFADVAREVSTHAPTKAYGGDIGGLVPKGYSTGERAAIEDTAFSLGINEVSQPLQVESKWYLVMPTEKTAYQEPTLQEMHDNIHAIMLNQEVDPYLEEWRKNLWDKASIEIKYPIYQNIAATDFTPGGSGSFIAPVIAVVNGKSIPEGAFFFHLLREHGRETVLSQIETIILNQQAPEMDVEATTEEARSMLQSIYDAGKLAVLDTAFTPDILDRTMVREMSALGVKRKKTQEIVQEQGIEITDDQVMQYYLDNLPRWSRPDMVRFSMIVTASQADAAAARQRIVNGESFETVCRAVSTNEPTRAYGGDVGYINKGYATGDSKIIEDTAFNLEVGGVSQPFQVGSNWFIIKLTDKQAAYEPTFPEKHDEIYTRLLQDRVAPFLFGWRRDLWNAASIRVVYPIYADNPSPAFSEQPAPTTGE